MPTTLPLRIADTIDRATLMRRTLGVILAIVAGILLATLTNGSSVSGTPAGTSPDAAACILARAALPCALLAP